MVELIKILEKTWFNMENSNRLNKKKYVEKYSLLPNKMNVERIKDWIITHENIII